MCNEMYSCSPHAGSSSLNRQSTTTNDGSSSRDARTFVVTSVVNAIRVRYHRTLALFSQLTARACRLINATDMLSLLAALGLAAASVSRVDAVPVANSNAVRV